MLEQRSSENFPAFLSWRTPSSFINYLRQYAHSHWSIGEFRWEYANTVVTSRFLCLGIMYQTAHQNDRCNAFRLYCKKTQPCQLVLWFQTSKTSQGTMSDSTSQPSSRAAKSGKFALLSRAIKHSDIHLEVLFLQNRKSFEYFFCFHRTLGISPKDLEGIKADVAFTYTTLACSLAISTNLNIHWNFIDSCVIRSAFWLVSRKDDCPERVLRKSFWIKKLTNKISLHLSN